MEKKSILLVEDNPDHGVLIKTRLVRLDGSLDITLVETAEDALARFIENPFDLVLSDFELPGMNGMELLRALRGRGQEVPFIFLTGQGSVQMIVDALRLGISDYFTKEEGFSRYDLLVESINRALSKTRVEKELQSEQKVALKALEESERKYSALVEQATDGVIIAQDGCFAFVNRGMEEVSGYSREELTGRPFDSYLTIESARLVREMHTRRIAGEPVPRIYEIQALHKDGTVRDVEMSLGLIEVNDKPASMAIVRDATSRKQIEIEARKFVSLVENSKEFIGMADLEGNVTYVNEAGLRLVGLESLDDIGGCTIYDFVNPGLKPFLKDEVIERVRTAGIWEGDALLRHFKTGKSIDVHVATFLVRDPARAQPICLATIMRDITAEKRAREMLEAQNVELQGFMHAVSHDLKTPLVTIREYSSLLMKDFSDRLPGDELHIIERLNLNSLKAIEMIKGLQNYAQYASRKNVSERFNLGRIIKEVLSDLNEGRGLPQGVSIQMQENWPFVMGDRTIMYQVFLNLITNAVKYGGKTIEIGWSREAGDTLVRIRDDGIGIEEDFLEKAFEVFTRSPRVVETTEGTGMGLALVKKSVERHGGRVWCESASGGGAAFFFTIPPAAPVDDMQRNITQ